MSTCRHGCRCRGGNVEVSGAGSRLAAFQAWRKRGVGGWRGHIAIGLFRRHLVSFLTKNILIVSTNLNLIRGRKNIDEHYKAFSMEVKVQNLSKTKITLSFNTH